jgi:hypothetical protein
MVKRKLSLLLIKYNVMKIYRVLEGYVFLCIRCHGRCIAGGRTSGWASEPVWWRSRREKSSRCLEIEPPAMTILIEVSQVPRP